MHQWCAQIKQILLQTNYLGPRSGIILGRWTAPELCGPERSNFGSPHANSMPNTILCKTEKKHKYLYKYHTIKQERKIRNRRRDWIRLFFYSWIFNYIWVQTGRNHVDATKSSDTQRQRQYFVDCVEYINSIV